METKSNGKLSPNMENYLEAISLLGKNQAIVRVKDISRLRNVKTSSTTGALSILSKCGLVVHERYGYVELTAKGRRVAQRIQRRYDILIEFFSQILYVDAQIAAEDACKTGRVISQQTFGRLIKFVEFVEANSKRDRPRWLRDFGHYIKSGKRCTSKMSQAERKKVKK